MHSKIKKISFKGQNIYIGIDVHFKSWVITIMIGTIVYKTFSQNPDAKELSKYLQNNFPDGNYYSVYEAAKIQLVSATVFLSKIKNLDFLSLKGRV